MIRVRGSVEYRDGAVVEFKAGSVAFRAWERYAGRQGFAPYDQSHPNELAAYVAYFALQIDEGFDVWLATVFDVDVVRPDGSPLEGGEANGEVELVPPTLAVPSLAPSSSSPS